MKNKPDKIILEGVVGSVAYGLNHEGSDEDIKGIYLAKTTKVLELNYNHEKASKVSTNPDWSYHELQKFMKLAMQANPTILELLFLDKYTELDTYGEMLVENRDAFLSNKVYHAYGGYALSQARKLNARGGTYSSALIHRKEKHTRHCFRLLLQGRELLETGTIRVKVTPEEREHLFWLGEQPVDVIVKTFEEEFKKFDTIKSVLPDKPDLAKINKLLLDIRQSHWLYPRGVGNWTTHGKTR